MTELYASAMIVLGTLGTAVLAIMVSRPVAAGARSRLDTATRE